MPPPSLLGLPAGAPQGRRGLRRSGLSARAAERCARRARSSVPRALRAARRPLVRSPARLPGPPLRLSLPPLLARSLARTLARSVQRWLRSPPPPPSRPQPARPLCALPPYPARPFPPPVPERSPLARRGLLLLFALGSPFSQRRITYLSPQVRSHRDQGGGGALPSCPLARPHPARTEQGTDDQRPGNEVRWAPGAWVLEENHTVLVPGGAPRWGN